MSQVDLTSERKSARVDTDFVCVRCGYNLRSLARDALCPECGNPVSWSAEPTGLKFNSPRSMRRTRLGIGIWAAALALPALTRAAFTVVALSSSALYFKPVSEHGLLGVVYRYTAYANSSAWFVAGLLLAAAVLLITQPLTRQPRRSRSGLAVTASALAVLTACSSLFFLVPLPAALTSMFSQVTYLAVFAPGAVSAVVSQMLTWLYLAFRLEPRASGRLRRVMHASLIAPIMIMLGALASVLVLWTSLWLRAAPGSVISLSVPGWVERLREISYAWSTHGDPICQIVMLGVLCAFVRTLNRALHISR